jgi:hypothetical protein
MARAVTPRELSGATSTGAGHRSPHRGITFRLATPADDPAIRRLLRETPMDGAMRLTFEREPNAFLADAVEGDFHQTIVATDAAGVLVGIGGRSVRDAYVNGHRTRLGYLGQLRVAPGHRGRDMILGGYDFLRDLHADGRAPFYLTSILTDNRPARRLLEAGLPGMPVYHPVAEFTTFVLPTSSRRVQRPAARRAAGDEVAELTACLARNHARFQFAPAWRIEDVAGSARTPNLAPTDFLRVGSKGGAGCVAVWDQTPFKQTVVRDYTGNVRRWRWLANALSPLTGWPRLPGPGRPLRQTFLSHLAVDGDDPDLFHALLNGALTLAAARGADYLVAGLAARHPLHSSLARWPHRAIRSTLYAVHWGGARAAVEQLDGRACHVEVATL